MKSETKEYNGFLGGHPAEIPEAGFNVCLSLPRFEIQQFPPQA